MACKWVITSQCGIIVTVTQNTEIYNTHKRRHYPKCCAKCSKWIAFCIASAKHGNNILILTMQWYNYMWSEHTVGLLHTIWRLVAGRTEQQRTHFISSTSDMWNFQYINKNIYHLCHFWRGYCFHGCLFLCEHGYRWTFTNLGKIYG